MGLFPPAGVPRLREGVRLGPMLLVYISERAERLECGSCLVQVSHSGEDVDDRFRGETGHGG